MSPEPPRAPTPVDPVEKAGRRSIGGRGGLEADAQKVVAGFIV
jgi:hypothetical protein